jgi:hypothetical protein
MVMRTALLLCLLFGAGAALAQPVAPEKRAEIERLFDITGASAIGQQMAGFFVKQLAQEIQRGNPRVPQYVLDAVPEEVDTAFKEAMPALRELIIPLYDKHFTLEELRGLNAFYTSPLGRKTTAVMPALMNDSMTLGARWGRDLGPRIAERLRARFKDENLKI